MSIRVSPALFLDITTYGGATLRRRFERPIITVGKLSTCSLTLGDAEVSRRHCVIEQTSNGRWRLTDLGSTHGTHVNGRPTVQSWLHDDDTITVGRTQIRVSLSKDCGDAPEQEVNAETPQTPSAETMFAGSRLPDSGKAKGRPHIHVSLIRGDTLVSADRFDARQSIRVGATGDCQLFLPPAALRRHDAVLVQSGPQGPALNLSIPELSGEVLHDEQVRSLDSVEGPWLPLKAGMRARMVTGDFTVLLSYGYDEPLRKRSAWADVNFTPANFIVGSALVHLLVLGFGAMMPEDPLRSLRDPIHQRQRLVKIMRIANPTPPRPLVDEPESKPHHTETDALSLADTPQVIADATTPTATERLVDKLHAHQKHRRRDATLSNGPAPDRTVARGIAKRTGVHAVLGQRASLFNRVLESKRFDATEVAWLNRGGGPEDGALVTDVFGPNGPGTGPHNWIGLNSDAARPLGPGSPLGHSKKRRSTRKLDLTKKTSVIADIRSVVVSGRNRSQVAKRIRRYLSGISWCLRSALQHGDADTGKMRLKFAIGPDGKVFGVNIRGAGSPSFKACAKQKVRFWRFGALETGGVTHVSYPVVLKVRK